MHLACRLPRKPRGQHEGNMFSRGRMKCFWKDKQDTGEANGRPDALGTAARGRFLPHTFLIGAIL